MTDIEGPPPLTDVEGPPLVMDADVSPSESSAPPPRGRRGLRRLAIVLAVVVALLGGAAGYMMWISAGSASGRPVAVVIPSGASAGEIADLLAAKGVIRAPWLFGFVTRVRGAQRSLRAGEYELRTGLSYSAALAALRKGPAVAFTRVTIPEGLTVQEVAALVATKTRVTAAAFLAAARSGAHRGAIAPPDPSNPEGLLFPKTYDFLENVSADDIVARLVAQFDKETAGLDWSRAKALGVTPYQAVIVASMIEREAKLAQDRPKIAAVIYNRLRRGMPLQIDATVQYAIFLKTGAYKSRVLYADLRIDSPFNTYRIHALPPAPIAGPGLASLRAALNPANVDYLYYVLMNDQGLHGFASTQKEFERLKAQSKAG